LIKQDGRIFYQLHTQNYILDLKSTHYFETDQNYIK